jgi:hypothetical protein
LDLTKLTNLNVQKGLGELAISPLVSLLEFNHEPTGWPASFLLRIWMRPRSQTTLESAMSTKEVRTNGAAGSTSVANLDLKLELVVIPVSDVDRAKEFYSRLGWRLDADRSIGDNFRLVQFTPPGSGSSIQFGLNLTSAAARFGASNAPRRLRHPGRAPAARRARRRGKRGLSLC